MNKIPRTLAYLEPGVSNLVKEKELTERELVFEGFIK